MLAHNALQTQHYETASVDSLLAVLIEVVKDICEAEAASLLLHDPITDELYFDVAIGEAGGLVKRIRMARGAGVVGHVFETMQPLLVSKVANDERFSPSSDENTGFRTRSILALPLLGADRRRVGVVEAVNHRSHSSFSEKELARLLLIQEPLSAAVSASLAVRAGQQQAIEDFYVAMVRIVGLRSEIVSQRSEELQLAKQEFEDERDRVVREARIAGLGYFVAGLSHEMNNPLGFVSSNLNSLRSQLADLAASLRKERKNNAGLQPQALMEEVDETLQDASENLGESLEGLGRLRIIAERLNSFSSMTLQRTDALDLVEVVERVIERTRGQGLGDKRLEFVPHDLPTLLASARHIEQVVVHLIDNALQNIADDGVVRVSLETSRDDIQLSVVDNGRGIAHERIGRIFDPFYTDKKQNWRATGLGLAEVYGIVMAHGGNVEVASEPHVGSSFVVTLPINRTGAKGLRPQGQRQPSLRYYE